ncbi:MAG: 50S ribosomal protein L6 [Firmicutes bacterium]|jgi:large subunit ribosomal protein L6|nr:50S ribosomal protein L6 [Bacillota bacterium]MDD3297672.1 50S ribosomal protein L6 [Bacillota bacterium]MDD3850433.1 50S ribosomal protein L6 [Bacillota bacterium]MDD4706628.1 50S ribosomal protein L6 [Bacillota bacterium]
MSRIGKLPIKIPGGVEVTIGEGNFITVKGPLGKMERSMHKDMIITKEDDKILVKRPSDNKPHKSLHGLTRSLIANMVEGVTKGYQKILEINGVGYRAQKQGKKLVLSVGYSHPVEMNDPDGITVEVEGTNKILVKGIDKQQVGNYAAKIRNWREPEPYKGKGIKYDNEHIRRKVGKTGK